MTKPQIETFTVCRDDTVFEGWPDLIRLQSGKLLLVYNECNAHGDRNHSVIAMRTSNDQGNTWSEKKHIGPETQHGDHWNSIRVNQMSDGRILLVCDRVIGSELSSKTELYLWESADEGDSWTTERAIHISGYCSDKIRELSDGTYILCVSVYNSETGKTEIKVHRSTDHGKTWSFSSVAASDLFYTFIEPALLECNGGKLVVFLRENSLAGYNGFMAVSYDGGKTFEKETQIPLTGMHRPFVGYLKDGRILLSYREHLSNDMPYPDLKASIFTEAELFTGMQNTHIFQISHDTSTHPDQGYSAWVQLDDGTIYMVNYITNEAPRAYIQGYRIVL